ncbi:hypothetical protein MFIFM68171_01969 [Madurella fahalii]|uniref:Uncharacterized protein n=1 Tax=Madurella fahalii TaxID=1157608 RepID=A0ABQ0G254_9PEZI
MNFTILVPEGTQNHGNPNLLCPPTQWHDFIIFFFSNYFAHAATVVPVPGQSLRSSIVYIFLALALPGSAVMRAFTAIVQRAVTARDPLTCAARAGALCMVVTKKEPPGCLSKIQPERGVIEFDKSPLRSEILPSDEDHNISTSNNIRDDELRIPATSDPNGQQAVDFHARDEESGLALNSGDDAIKLPKEVEYREATLASNYNLLKLCISLVQATWATITIYRARGDQISHYGYAAFGLTVAPYAFMSIMNSFANMLTPEYPSMFVIRTPTMNKAEEHNCAFFKEAINVKPVRSPPPKTFLGRLGRDLDRLLLDSHDNSTLGSLWILAISLLLSLIPLAVVGVLSRFQKGNSTQIERGFTMAWLIVGVVYGLGIALGESQVMLWVFGKHRRGNRARFLGPFFILLTLGVPAIGGMVMVGIMMENFGTCTLVV